MDKKIKREINTLTELVKIGRYDILRDDYHFQYIITAPDFSITSKYLAPKVIYRDKQAMIYSLNDDGNQ